MNDHFGFGTAIYHPFIDIDDSKWLRSALLFWDGMFTIVPSSIKRPYRTRETKILAAEGFLKPLAPENHSGALDRIEERVLALVEAKGDDALGFEVGESVLPHNPWLMHGEKVGSRLRDELEARLHREKLPPSLLRRVTPLPRKADDFIPVDPRFASSYMAVLASELARECGAAPLTGSDVAFGTNVRALLADASPLQPRQAAEGTLVSIAIEQLVIDPTVPIEQLLAFKRTYADELQGLAIEFDKLAETIKAAEDVGELREKAARVYLRDVQPGIHNLQKRLRRNAIGSVLGGAAIAATLGTAATVSTAGAVLLGGAAFLTLSSFAFNSRFVHLNARMDSPFSYLLNVREKLSLPTRLLED